MSAWSRPVKVAIASAVSTKVEGRAYTYSFISPRIPAELRGYKATPQPSKLPDNLRSSS